MSLLLNDLDPVDVRVNLGPDVGQYVVVDLHPILYGIQKSFLYGTLPTKQRLICNSDPGEYLRAEVIIGVIIGLYSIALITRSSYRAVVFLF